MFRRRPFRLLMVAVPTAVLGLTAAGVNSPAAQAAATSVDPAGAGPGNRPACGEVAAPLMRCYASYRPAAPPARQTTGALPEGYSPTSLQAAYRLPSISRGDGQTIAIVDAYDNPNAEADLAVYRSTYRLPPCTSSNGCFRKVGQNGQTRPLPPADPGWATEISLDLDMVSAVCPRCKILLVEADEPASESLGAAVDTAVRLGAMAVSNSYGTNEFNGMAALAHFWRHPGTIIIASTGDFGFGPASFPAVLSSVVAVGGTSLTRAPATPRGWTERAWSGAASGCSAYVAKPSWQHDPHCPMRTVADVSAVADPATGVAVYDRYQQPGWLVVGGTSASAPLVAGVYGLAGNARSIGPSYPYQHRRALFDVIGGSTGFCGGDYLCTGRIGYDAPTGLGTPDGTGGF